MPEGDAVRRTALRLDRALAGREVTRSDFRVPQLATSDLRGRVVHGTATHGKHLFTRIGELTLHTHLKMEGTWRSYRPGARWDRPGHLARVVLTTEHGSAVGFALGLVELFPTTEEATVTDRLGPDLLGAEWDAAAAGARLAEDPDRVLGEALLDQTVVAGMGTIWVAESCFAHGVHPQGPVSQVADPARFVERVRRMLHVAVERGRPITTGNQRAPMWVYRRHRQPCRRCGTTVEAGPVGPPGRERTTYWCPGCQPRT
ncbi:hypothetical protein KUV85_06405 [Nocardioides panacisoli]|uniref:DNA-formamidopyrimidine glycosylase family protein n=1 Tax=Nocardioides panacisoli TaxID=627624 RepID=UPI001C624EDD|nr:DNA-formamidopyrimidine glycosylase family protein [Nocardioides panacisoli]QYJ05305.1 hypothetical protein KUV85_06405 [Nocardioides panacisoli]